MAQVVGGTSPQVAIEGLVGERHRPGDELLQDGSGTRRAQPVVHAVGLRCRDDRFVERLEGPARLSEQLSGPQRQGAAHAVSVGVEPLLHAAVRTDGQSRHSGTQRAACGGRSGRNDQPALLPAIAALAASSKGRPVARLAHRPLGPAGTCRALLSAVSAAARSPRAARHADGSASGDEVADERAASLTASSAGGMAGEHSMLCGEGVGHQLFGLSGLDRILGLLVRSRYGWANECEHGWERSGADLPRGQSRLSRRRRRRERLELVP